MSNSNKSSNNAGVSNSTGPGNSIGWELKITYDYRFCALLVQAIHNGETSPPYNIPIKDVIKNMPRHEVLEAMKLADDPMLPKDDIGIEVYRRAAIRDTDMRGKVVLDIGGYDGWAAKLALECGAVRAICLDNHQYEHYGWEDKKLEGVEYIQGDVMRYVVEEYINKKAQYEPTGQIVDLLDDTAAGGSSGTVPSIDRPDILINYNVLYHTKNPWAFLDKCREVIKEDGEMLLCTLFRYHDGAWMYVYEPRECNHSDDTVYFGLSLTALERLLKHTGWDYEQVGLAYDRVVYRCKPISGWQRKHGDT